MVVLGFYLSLVYIDKEVTEVRKDEAEEELAEQIDLARTLCAAEDDTRLVLRDMLNYLNQRRRVVVTTEPISEDDQRFQDFYAFSMNRLGIPPPCQAIIADYEARETNDNGSDD